MGYGVETTVTGQHAGWRPERLRDHREAFGLTLEAAGEELRAVAIKHKINLAANFQTISDHERGETYPGPQYRKAYGLLYRASDQELGFRPALVTEGKPKEIDSPQQHGIGLVSVDRRALLGGGLAIATGAASSPLLDALNQTRAAADLLLETQSVSPASLDRWEETADTYGLLQLNAAPDAFLAQVVQDFRAVQNLLSQHQPLRVQQRLYRVMAQMSGLIAIVSNDVGWDSRHWFHTARRAAEECNDPALAAWAMAHESMTFLWNGQPMEKGVNLAQAAQAMVGSIPSPAGSLAAVMEARLQSQLGHTSEALAAVRRSDIIFERLSTDETRVNVLGFYEHLLRFCQSNALTAIGETSKALEIQQRALELPAANTVDAGLLEMDRATCLIAGSEIEAGYQLATRTLLNFPIKSRAELVAVRARDLLRLAPEGEDQSSELRELLRSEKNFRLH